MEFLTIEKFTPHRNSWFRNVLVALFLLVVPIIIMAAWVFMDLVQSGTMSTQAATGINPQITYQGKIADTLGTAVTDGSGYSFRFEIYNTVSGGITPIWSETQSSVSITGGIFSITLGSVTPILSTIFNSDSLYLQVYFNDGVNPEETFSPRKRLTASPYAMNSDLIDGMHATTTATANQLLALDANSGLTMTGITTTNMITNSLKLGSSSGVLRATNGLIGVTTIDLSDTNITAGTNISIGGNAISVVNSPTFSGDLTVQGTSNLQVTNMAYDSKIGSSDGSSFWKVSSVAGNGMTVPVLQAQLLNADNSTSPIGGMQTGLYLIGNSNFGDMPMLDFVSADFNSSIQATFVSSSNVLSFDNGTNSLQGLSNYLFDGNMYLRGLNTPTLQFESLSNDLINTSISFSTSTDRLSFNGASGGYNFNDGYVGIGYTGAPPSLFSVNGNSYFNGNSTATGNLIVVGTSTLATTSISNLNGLLYGTNGVVGTIATSSLGILSVETDPYFNAVSTTIAYLANNNTFTGTNILATTTLGYGSMIGGVNNYLTVTQTSGVINTPVIKAFAYTGGLTVQNQPALAMGATLLEDNNTNPDLVFSSANGLSQADIIYVTSTGVMQFANASGGYTFDNNVTTTGLVVANNGYITLGGVAKNVWPSGGGDSLWATSTGSAFIYPASTGYQVVIGASVTSSNDKFQVNGSSYLGGNLAVTGTSTLATTTMTGAQIGNNTTNIQMTATDIGGGLIAPIIKFTSPDLAGIWNSGMGIISNSIFVSNQDTSNPVSILMQNSNSSGNPISIYSTSSDDVLRFSAPGGFNFEGTTTLAVASTTGLIVNGYINFNGDSRTTWPVGGGGGDSLWATSTPNVIHPSSVSNDIVVIGASGTSSPNTKFEVTGNSVFTGNVTTTANLYTGSLNVGSLSGILFANNGAVSSATVSTPLAFSAGTLSLNKNIANLILNGSNQLDTIQNIGTTSAPTFGGLIINGNSTTTGNASTTGNQYVGTLKIGTLNGLISATNGVIGTTSTISISQTNLATSAPITLTGSTIGLAYNTTNLKITTNQLNTIQDIAVASAPTFGGLTVSGDLTVDTNTLYVSSTGNNVGIGTLSPSAKLDITAGSGDLLRLSASASKYMAVGFNSNGKGALNFDITGYTTLGDTPQFAFNKAIYANANLAVATSTSASAPGLFFVGDSNTGLFSSANDVLGFSASGTEAMRIVGSGFIGIGTTSPQARLHVSLGSAGYPTFNSANDALLLENGSSNLNLQMLGAVGTSLSVKFSKPTVNGQGYLTYTTNATPANDLMTFGVNNATRMAIDGRGFVGIGTTTLSRALNVESGGNGDVTLNNTNSSGYTGIVFRNSGVDNMYVGHGGSGYNGMGASGANNSWISTVGDLYFKTHDLYTNTMALIGSTGYVGIGTITPNQKLEVYDGNLKINSGINAGTSSPSVGVLLFDNQFDNSGSSTANKIVLYNNDPAIGGIYGIGLSKAFGTIPTSFDLFSGSVGSFNFYSNHKSEANMGDKLMTIQYDGKVGIGTDVPSAYLSVYGANITTNVLRVGNASNSDMFVVDGAGNFIIGASSLPSYLSNGNNIVVAAPVEDKGSFLIAYQPSPLTGGGITGGISLVESSSSSWGISKYSSGGGTNTVVPVELQNGFAIGYTYGRNGDIGLVMNAINIRTSTDIGIGDVIPTARLQVNKNNLQTATDTMFAISTGGSNTNYVFKVWANGQAFADGAYSSGGADYAEYFYSSDVGLVSGEAVCLDVANSNTVRRCSRSADPDIMGIVSSRPSTVGNYKKAYENNPNYAIVGLLGQVPAKVSAENGAIRPGDSLTSASQAGYLMKAVAGDSTVGVALEELVSGTGVVNVLISRRNKSITVEQVEEKVIQAVASMKLDDEARIAVNSAINNFATANSSVLSTYGERIAVLETGASSTMNLLTGLQAQVAGLLAGTSTLQNTASSSVQSISELTVGTLIVQNNLVVKADAMFEGKLTVMGSAEFNGAVKFKDHLTVDEDTAGSAIIFAGATSTEIKFSKPYNVIPKVVANLQSSDTPMFAQYVIASKTINGFLIALSQPATADLTFDWLAVASSQITASSNNNSTPPVMPEDTSSDPGVGSSTPPVVDNSSSTDSNGSSTPPVIEQSSSTPSGSGDLVEVPPENQTPGPVDPPPAPDPNPAP